METRHIHFGRNVGNGSLTGCSSRAQWRYVEPDDAIVVFARVWGQSVDSIRMKVFHTSDLLGRCGDGEDICE